MEAPGGEARRVDILMNKIMETSSTTLIAKRKGLGRRGANTTGRCEGYHFSLQL